MERLIQREVAILPGIEDGVRKDELTSPRTNVELNHVHADLQRRVKRFERVGGRERARSPVPDPLAEASQSRLRTIAAFTADTGHHRSAVATRTDPGPITVVEKERVRMTDASSMQTSTVSTVSALPASARERFGERNAVRYKRDGEWKELTYAEAVDAIQELALGLVDLGIGVGDRVSVLADTRWEWTLASYAITAAGGVVVPVYPTNCPKRMQVGARQLRGAGRVLRERRPEGENRSGPRRARRARARDRDRGGRWRADARRAPRARPWPATRRS